MSSNERTGTMGPVTLATIAAKLGVSRSTVSNAYNHPDQLSAQLRENIFRTAEELGYTGPDPVARRLRQGSAGAIGVLFSEPLQQAFADAAATLFLEGVAAAGEEADLGMLLIPARPSEESASVITNAIVDGFILYSIPPGHPFVDAALRRRLPVVCVDQTRIGGVSWVGIDDRSAAREAAQHLLSNGHRRIAILVYGLAPNENTDDVTWDVDADHSPTVSWLRLAGYHDALVEAGLSWSDVTVMTCDRNVSECGESAAKHLLTLSDRPTALLCTSDALALGALGVSSALGLSVPEDLSIIGFNDIPAARSASLTTISQPLVDKGRQAGNLLIDKEKSGEQRLRLDAHLVHRNSAGPAPY